MLIQFSSQVPRILSARIVFSVLGISAKENKRNVYFVETIRDRKLDLIARG